MLDSPPSSSSPNRKRNQIHHVEKELQALAEFALLIYQEYDIQSICSHPLLQRDVVRKHNQHFHKFQRNYDRHH